MRRPWFEVSVRLPLARFELDVDLGVDRRRIGVFGPSGAGKTSLLECVAGWRRPARGTVRVAGRTLFDHASGSDVPRRERRVGYVPQDALLFPHWDVRGNLEAGGTLDARAVEVLELGPLLDRRPDTLSGGERRRVALARALCSAPEVLLLDEPLGALDRPLRRRILPFLVRVGEEFDLPMLFVSHDPTEVQALCEFVYVLEEGRLVAEGAPAEVLATAAGEADFENVLRGRVHAAEGDTAAVELPGGARVRVPSAGLATGDEVLFGLRAEDVLVARAPVEGLSARNVVAARVDSLRDEGGAVVLRARLGEGGPVVSVLLTAESTAELGLAPGVATWLLFKTRACHVLATAGRGGQDGAG